MLNKEFKQTKEVVKYAAEQGYLRGRVLDLGAGQAKYKSIIKEKANEYVAFDLIPGKNIDVVGEINNTDLPAESFETVVCTQVFEHIATPWLAVKEIKRLLKPNGICLLTAPFLEAYHADPHDYFRYTTEGVIALFKNEGFEIVEGGICGAMYLVLTEFLRFTLFSSYKKARRGNYRATLYLNKLAQFLNKFSRNKTIYTSSYVIAKKL